MLRSFTIRDLGLLRKYKQQIVYLNNQSLLARGSASFSRAAWLSPFSSLTGTLTYVSETDETGNTLIGQVEHGYGSPVAYCNFLAPREELRSSTLVELVDMLLVRVGERGAQSLLAELDEDDSTFAQLRQAGFSIYARQRVWRIDHSSFDGSAKTGVSWRNSLSGDQLAIHLLRISLLPGQVQQIENRNTLANGYVYYREGQLLAYIEVARGSHGIWLQPFVHLDAEPFDSLFAELIAKLRPRPNRAVYICLRSYQDWLESTLKNLGAEPGPYQAALARRTVKPLKVEARQRVPVVNRSAEPTMPIHAPIVTRRHEPEWIIYDQTPNYR